MSVPGEYSCDYQFGVLLGWHEVRVYYGGRNMRVRTGFVSIYVREEMRLCERL